MHDSFDVTTLMVQVQRQFTFWQTVSSGFTKYCLREKKESKLGTTQKRKKNRTNQASNFKLTSQRSMPGYLVMDLGRSAA